MHLLLINCLFVMQIVDIIILILLKGYIEKLKTLTKKFDLTEGCSADIPITQNVLENNGSP